MEGMFPLRRHRMTPNIPLLIVCIGSKLVVTYCRTGGAGQDGNKKDSRTEVSAGTIGGIVALACLLLLTILMCCICKRCKGRKHSKTAKKYATTQRPVSGISRISAISGSSIEERPVSQAFYANDIVIEEEDSPSIAALDPQGMEILDPFTPQSSPPPPVATPDLRRVSPTPPLQRSASRITTNTEGEKTHTLKPSAPGT